MTAAVLVWHVGKMYVSTYRYLCVWEEECVCIQLFVYVRVFAALDLAHNR